MKCAYCKNEATTEDAVGIPACKIHESDADEYFKQRTGRKPNEDTFLHCQDHLDFWQSDCDRCEECCQHHYGITVEEKFGKNRVLGDGIKVVNL